MKYSPRTDDLSISESRLVVLGDPHGDLVGLARVLAAEDDPDTQLVSVGDNIGYADGPTSSELCRELEELRIPSVYGNHEEWMGEDGSLTIVRACETNVRLTPSALKWCRALPQRLNLCFSAAPSLNVAVVHHVESSYFDFVPDDVRVSLERHRAQVVLVGHTHGPKVYECTADGDVAVHRLDLRGDDSVRINLRSGHRYVVDAGSLANPGHHPDPSAPERASYAVVDVRRGLIALKSLGKRPL